MDIPARKTHNLDATHRIVFQPACLGRTVGEWWYSFRDECHGTPCWKSHGGGDATSLEDAMKQHKEID